MKIRRTLAALPLLVVACCCGRQALRMSGDEAFELGGDSTSAALGGMICAGLACIAAGAALLTWLRGDFLGLLSQPAPGPTRHPSAEADQDRPLFD